MIVLNAGDPPWSDWLEVGDGMSIRPTGTALVELWYVDGTRFSESLAQARRYGPYPRTTRFRVSCLTGTCAVAQVAIASALFVEGWEDLRFPAQGINPAGAINAPTVDTTLTGYPGTLLFAGNQENVIAGVAQLPHGWKVGTPIRPHIHWSKPVGSADAVTWVLYYRILGSAGDAHGALVGPVAATATAGDPTTTNAMLLTAFGDIALTGQRESTCLNWQIRRLGNTDADNGTARLFEFDLHYQTDKSGTINEFPA